ncbi:hypothetical protein PVK06_004151 [Gossypium arboreum]|uniref:Uncharacterized protein n=1 Tax=Gossypium arboreum TaxID=29729 RepID=A0ABR0QR68_GOSAR|nr:hypothetical protein PVK06_004151 [Gossypium arboreum]
MMEEKSIGSFCRTIHRGVREGSLVGRWMAFHMFYTIGLSSLLVVRCSSMVGALIKSDYCLRVISYTSLRPISLRSYKVVKTQVALVKGELQIVYRPVH